jgi:hypothetical protein
MCPLEWLPFGTHCVPLQVSNLLRTSCIGPTFAALRPLAAEGSGQADEVPASLAYIASNGPVISAPGYAESHLRSAR